MKKALSLILVWMLLFSAIPLTAGAAGADLAETGMVINGVTGDCAWSFDSETETLTVSGSGKMADYNASSNKAPWNSCVIKKLVIKNGVTRIGNYALYSQPLTAVTIPDSVESIGKSAFDSCQDLTTVKLGKNVKTIDMSAFYQSGLTSVVLPDSVEYLGYMAFAECQSLAQAQLGKNLKLINGSSFRNTALTGIVIPGSVESIGAYAFSGTPLTSVNISAGVKIIGIHTFENTPLNAVAIPGSVEEIGEKAFYNCGSLVSVKIGSGVKTVGEDAFCNTGLTEITIPASVSEIGAYAFGYTYSSWTGEHTKTGFYTVMGMTGSAARTYAVENGLSFTVIYTVAFNANGHGAAPAEQILVAGDKAVKPADPSAAGWTFGGWFTDAACTKAYDFNTDVIKNYTLYAKWTQKLLATPKITKFENFASGVRLTIGKVTGAAKYRIFLKVSGKWTKLADVTALTYLHKGVKSGTKYTFTVRCLAKDGKSFTSKYYASGWTTTFIATPALPTLKNTKNGVQVTIKKVTGAAKYRIFRKTGSGKWGKLADTAKLTYVDKTAKKGVTYRYTIRCITASANAFTSSYNATGRAIKCVR